MRCRSPSFTAASTTLAMSNSLDLRPATAAAPETLGNSHSGGGRFGSGRFNGIQVDVGSHGDLIKETDLGCLSASLFTPTHGRINGISPDTSGKGGFQYPGAGGGGRVSSSGGRSIPSPTRISALSAAVNASHSGEFAGASTSGPRGSRSPRRVSGVGLAATSPLSTDLPPSLEGLPDHHHTREEKEDYEPGGQSGGGGDRDQQRELLAGGSASMFPQQRVVQSARPVTRGGQEHLDPSVWKDRIESQVGW